LYFDVLYTYTSNDYRLNGTSVRCVAE
jgi:hypothetical protein